MDASRENPTTCGVVRQRLRVRYASGGWFMPMPFWQGGVHGRLTEVSFGPWPTLDALWYDVRGAGRALK